MKKIILLTVLATFTFAQDYLILNGFSRHLDTNVEYVNGKKVTLNENNWGLGIEREFEEMDTLGIKLIPFAMGHGFIDSYDKLAGSLGGGVKKRFPLFSSLNFDIAALAFGVYKNEFNGVRLGIIPFASIGTEQARINVGYIPAYEIPQSIAFVNFSIAIW